LLVFFVVGFFSPEVGFLHTMLTVSLFPTDYVFCIKSALKGS